MFHHLLVPLDGSHFAEKALPAALELAEHFGSKVTVMRVVAPAKSMLALQRGYAAAFGQLAELASLVRQEAEDYLRGVQQSLREQGYDAEVWMVEDVHVASAILAAVEQLQADTIVISTHGREGVRSWMLGSITNRVLQNASVPVLLIRSLEPDA
jgi:nucleotide-binding universal stress UspA family protein